MPYVISSSLSDSRSVSKEFEPEIDRRSKGRMIFGDPFTDEEVAALPKTLLVGRPRVGGIPHILGWSIGPFVVSPRVHRIIEELEPGRQCFLPLAVKSKDDRKIKGKTDHGTYYLIMHAPLLDAVVIEKTDFINGFGRAGFEASSRPLLSLAKGTSCVLDLSVAAGHHFWQGTEPLRQFYFCSDELRDRLKAEKLDGWKFSPRCEFDDE